MKHFANITIRRLSLQELHIPSISTCRRFHRTWNNSIRTLKPFPVFCSFGRLLHSRSIAMMSSRLASWFSHLVPLWAMN